MNDVGDYIKELRIKNGLTQEELGEQVGVKKAAVQKWESGLVQNLKRTTIKKLAEIFNVSPASFILVNNSSNLITSHDMGAAESSTSDIEELARYGIRPVKKIRLPLLGDVACGEPIYADEDRESYIDVDDDFGADFCLRAKGDSMINARINNGDIVFVRKQEIVNDGEIAVVIIDDEATLKRVYYYRNENKLVLQAENPKYKPLIYTNEELDTIRILGKAVAFQSNL